MYAKGTRADIKYSFQRQNLFYKLFSNILILREGASTWKKLKWLYTMQENWENSAKQVFCNIFFQAGMKIHNIFKAHAHHQGNETG